MTITSSVLADYAAGRLDWVDACAVEAVAAREAGVAVALNEAMDRVRRVHEKLMPR